MDVRLYARVSTDEQARKDLSIPAQLEKLKQYCKDNNYNIKGTYIDNGISAATIKKRKGLVKLLEDLQEGETILFTRLDRLSRNVLDSNLLVQKFNKMNVSIVSISEDEIDTSTADGKFMFDLRVSLAERERKKTSERIRDVFAMKRSKGEVCSGAVPLGFKIENKHMVVDEDTKKYPEFIFKTYLETQSAYATCWKFNSTFELTRSETQIRNILRNEKYREALIPIDTFDEVQRVLKSHRMVNERTIHTYMFNGIVYCGLDGSKMYANVSSKQKSGKFYKRYRCKKGSYGKQCVSISEIQLEQLVLEELEKLIDNEQEWVVEESKKEIVDYSKDIKSVKAKIKRLKDLYIDGAIDKDDFNRRLTHLNNDLTHFLEKQSKYTSDDKKALYSSFKQGKTMDLYKEMDAKQKHRFWRVLIDKIIIYSTTNIEVHWK